MLIFDLIKNILGSTKSGHLWVKREGTPGDYTYWYKMPDGTLASSKDPSGKGIIGQKGKPTTKAHKQVEMPEEKGPSANLPEESSKKRISETKDPEAPSSGVNPERYIKKNPILKFNAPKKPFSLNNNDVPIQTIRDRIEMAMTNVKLQGSIIKDNQGAFYNQAKKLANNDKNLEQELYSEGLMGALSYMKSPSAKLIERVKSKDNTIQMKDYAKGIFASSKNRMFNYLKKEYRERKGINQEDEVSLNQPTQLGENQQNLEELVGTQKTQNNLDIDGFKESMEGYLAESPLTQSTFKYIMLNEGLPFISTVSEGKQKSAQKWREQIISDLEDKDKQKMYGKPSENFLKASPEVKAKLLTDSLRTIKLYSLIEFHEQEEETRTLLFSDDKWKELEADLISGLNLNKINTNQKMGIKKYFQIQTKEEADYFYKEQEFEEQKQVEKRNLKLTFAKPILMKKTIDKDKSKNFSKFAKAYIDKIDNMIEALQSSEDPTDIKKSENIKLVFLKTMTITEAMEHKNVLGAGAKKRKKIKNKKDKVKVVMKEYKRGTLHSGSGDIVNKKSQAIAIALSEAKLTKKNKDKI
jgi:hypothetical protein